MWLIFVSYLAGILTILAPCVLPLLPIILWASVNDKQDRYKPYIIIWSLAVSVFMFTLLLKASTVFIGIDAMVWKVFSWVILVGFGIITLFPTLWEKVNIAFKLSDKSNQNLAKNTQKQWFVWDILVWLSLGPIFSSCSPTYGLIVAVVLPLSLVSGLVNLTAYVLWLATILLVIALLGQKFTAKLRGISDPKGKFKKILWIIFLVVWLAIITGLDKSFEAWLIEQWFYGITSLEESLLEKVQE